MIHEVEPSLNMAAYQEALLTFQEALGARAIGIDYAKSLSSSLAEYAHTFRFSVATDHFNTTYELLSHLTDIRRTSSNGDFVDSIPTFVGEVLQDVDKHIDEDPDTYLLPTYRLARTLSEKRDTKLASTGVSIQNNHFSRLLALSELTDREAQELIKQMVGTSNEQQFRDLVRAAITPDSPLLRRFPRPVDSILNLGLLGNNTQLRPTRMRIALDEITDGKGQQAMEKWDFSAGKVNNNSKGSESIYFDNFGVICQLEKSRPGITRVLMESYGVVNVTRYPIELLLEQYDTQEVRDASYGVLVTAGEDNGIALNIKRETESIYEQAKTLGIGLRVLEADTLEDILIRVNEVAAKHGDISYMLLLGHHFDSRLGGLAWRRELFTQSATIGLISCLTGRESGAAQNLSSTIGDIEVHAPEYVVWLKERGIQLEEVAERLNLKLLFNYAEGNFNTDEDTIFGLVSGTHGELTLRTGATNFYDVPTRVYKNGQFVRDYTS